MTSTAELRRSLHRADLHWERQYDLSRRLPSGGRRLDWLCAAVWAAFALWCLGTLVALAALATALA